MKSSLGVLFIALSVATAARAQLNRTAVSINGSDTNNCAVATPCRTFPVAIAQTNAGGEVIAVDSGGYAPFVIDRAITVMAAPGVYAGITAPQAGDAIDITASAGAKVVLRNLYLNSITGDSPGIFYVNGTATSTVYLENLFIQNFQEGIVAMWPVHIDDTRIHNCGVGIYSDSTSTIPMIFNRVSIKGPASSDATGVIVKDHASVVIRDSVIMTNATGVSTSGTAPVVLMENTVVTRSSAVGVYASNGVIRISNCMITDNAVGIFIDPGAVIASFEITGCAAMRSSWAAPACSRPIFHSE